MFNLSISLYFIAYQETINKRLAKILKIELYVIFLAARERRSPSFEPIINYFHVESRVATRFAETTIRGELQNPSDQNAQAEFMLFIPETAFISNYSMVIDDFVYIAEVSIKIIDYINYRYFF